MAAHIHLRAPGALLAPATPGSAMVAAGCTESVFALCIVFPFLSMAWARCALPYLHVPKVHSLGAECRPWQVSVVRSCSKQWMGLAAFQLLPGPCASRRHKQHRRREVNPHQHQRTRPQGQQRRHRALRAQHCADLFDQAVLQLVTVQSPAQQRYPKHRQGCHAQNAVKRHYRAHEDSSGRGMPAHSAQLSAQREATRQPKLTSTSCRSVAPPPVPGP